MSSQLRIVAEFMNLADAHAMELSNQEYLSLCDEVQFAHALVEHQPQKNQQYIELGELVISTRRWRWIKRSYLSTMTDCVLHAERIARQIARHAQNGPNC